jgi:WD40 repeat protein
VTLRTRIEGGRRPLRRGGPWCTGLGLLIAVLSAQPSQAQDEVRNFRMPILLVETGGHHARVRSLLWQDEFTLLSGGEDKVVKVWDFHQEPRLTRSIRPMIWRGPAGIIYAMAVTPKPDAQGQRFLAVAGYGIEASRGDITVFRIPGLARTPTGEVAARMLPPPDDQPQGTGYRDVVSCLAFDPDGRVLASGSADATIILWDVPAFRPRAVLRGHTRPIRALAFSPDGSRLASGSADGSLRIWDVARGVEVDSRAGNAARPNPINALAYSPDGLSIVVGLEAPGRLFLFQAGNLAAPPLRLPTLDSQGPVEYVAFHPDGRRPRLAVSIKSDASEVPDPVRMSCDVEIREMPGGAPVNRRRVPGLVYALAFSPDGRWLAYADGNGQSIQVVDQAAPDRPPREIRGAGTTAFDVRFSDDGKTIGLTREPFDPANPPGSYEGFDLERRKTLTISRDRLPHGAIAQYQGWTLQRSTNSQEWVAVQPNGPGRRFAIDPRLERHAWSSTFIPGTPGHPRTTVALGTESGVAIFDFETGARSRVYAGHSSPVVSLAPSRDGRWLASGSLDQTILLYPLDGCDTRPPLGAGFRLRPNRTYEVESVEKRSFAAAMGLIPTDVLVRIGVGWGENQKKYYNTAAEMDEFFRLVPQLEPYLYMIGLRVRRTMAIPTLGPLVFEVELPTTRRNNPALALFVGTDKEWVLWTPRGYYDTSIEGDSRYLGWHINAAFGSTRPTDFVPIGTYAGTMLRPRLLDRLWQTGDLDLAMVQEGLAPAAAQPERRVYQERPPRILFTSVERGVLLPLPGAVWTVDIPNPRLGLSIQAEDGSRIRARRVTFDERVLELRPVPGPQPAFAEELLVDLVPRRRVRLAVEATNEDGNKRTEVIDMVYIPPVEPPAPVRPRLVVLGLGVDRSRDPALLPPFRFADRDAVGLASFLADHLISPDGAGTVQDPPEDRRVLTSERATTSSLGQELERLGEGLRSKRLQKGDIVAVVIAAHVLEFDGTATVAAVDTDPARRPSPGPLIPAREISERLGELADYGCRVVVLLDGVRELPNDAFRSAIKPWVRDLQRERRVITFVASREGPSLWDDGKQHGLFALGVTRAFDQAVAAGKLPGQPYTLGEFGRAVRQMVLDLSGRQQDAFAYFPEGVSPDSPFARP